MVEKPLVSILTPVLNAEKYIEQCIESVLNQTYKKIEHVFADGGSTDKTIDILNRYTQEYPNRIQYISSADKGVGSGLRNAYNICCGEIIGWIDADDKYNDDAIEVAVDYFIKNQDIYFIYGHCNIINETNKKIGCFVIKEFDRKEWLNVWHYMIFCATFFKREVIEKVGFVNDLGNDLDFYFRVNKCFAMHRLQHTFSNWRLHCDSISLKPSKREQSIRKQRAKEDFYLVLKYRGSIFSPRALTYYGYIDTAILGKIRKTVLRIFPFTRKIDNYLKASIFVANRKGNSFAYPLFKKLLLELIVSIIPIKKKHVINNVLYNSANMGYEFNKAGQRINRIPSGTTIKSVKFFMDKIGNPVGEGACVVRKVKDDTIVGCLGTINLSILPDAYAPNPKWITFENGNGIKIAEKGDYRIIFEWDSIDGDFNNYPRVRYNDTNTIKGVFTQFNSNGEWIDHKGFDSSIKISF